MNIHEYQAKEVLVRFGVPVSRGRVADSVEGVVEAARAIGGNRWVAKVQVHTGGRGQAGGVVLADSEDQLREFAGRWLGQCLKTYQTGTDGLLVQKILVEECTEIGRELYFGAVLDRETRRVVFIASREGGVEIETVARDNPEAIFRQTLDPVMGPMSWQARRMAARLGLDVLQTRQFSALFVSIANAFTELDLSLVEINPLVVTVAGDLLCLDAKLNVDSNALYRQADLLTLRDTSQEDARELRAQEHDLNYVALDGDIGCMVNGAGLAMATMDIIKLHGGEPANFLDVGGNATRERVSEAFRIILEGEDIRAVLVNIFGGIVRCDLIAQGILEAVRDIDIHIPVVVRLQGNRAEDGLGLLAESGLAIASVADLDEAAQTCVRMAAAGV